MNKKLSIRLIKYELLNISGNFFTLFFGIVFPILMSAIISQAYMKDLPEEVRITAMTDLYITMSMVVPLSILLIGYCVTYALELEKEIPLRMQLFGFKQSTLLSARLIAYFIFTTGALLVYTAADCFILDIQAPTLPAAICYIVIFYLLCTVFFLLAHGIAAILKKFGPAYAASMTLYFIFMILCGFMGVSSDALPKGLKSVAYTLPMTYLSDNYVTFWQGGSYNFAPLIQSFLFLGAVTGIILLFGMKHSRRRSMGV